VDGTLSRVTGVGLVRGRTKTNAGTRTLRLPNWADSIIIRRRTALGDTGPIFPAVVSRSGSQRNRVGGGWRDPSNTGHSLTDAAERTGFDWITSHHFRKTGATMLYDSGRSARDAADQLGHSKVSVTQDMYFGRGTVSEANATALEDMFE
jgi:integrase